MTGTDMISYNKEAAENVCFSLPGALSVIPASFSFPAPELNFGFRFSVSAGIHPELQFIQERIEHFFISVAGLIRTVLKKKSRTAFCFIRKMNVLRARILKLSYAGRRL